MTTANSLASRLHDPAASAWLVCRTEPRHEARATRGLVALGAEGWCPTQTVTHQWSDRQQQLVEPLLRGYCFAHWAPGQWTRLLAVPGVRTVLHIDQVPSVVPEHEIDNLRAFVLALATSGLEPLPATSGMWRAGDPVCVVRGPFAGIDGRVIRRRGELRLVIMVELLGEGVMVTVPVADLAPWAATSVAA